MSLNFIKSQKGGEQLVVENFIFTIEKKIGSDIKIWKCKEYRNKNCKGRCKTDKFRVIKHDTSQHNHLPSVSKVKNQIAISNLKNEAKSTDNSPQNIINTSIKNLDASDLGNLPSLDLLKRTIHRERSSKINFENPSSIENLQIPLPEIFTKTFRDEEFILHDESGSERMIIFATRSNMKLLEESEMWFIDGTFKIAPEIFYQVYTVHGIKNNNVLPLIYALLPDKRGETYRKFFNIIFENWPQLSPKLIMSDFEIAAISAVQSVFPHSDQIGCHFHFAQCIWRKIQTFPIISARYVNESDFALNLRLLIALAFLPPDDVLESYKMLSELSFYQDPLLSHLLNYFEDTWVGRGPTGRNPMYPIKLWNCFNNVTKGLPKTNNSVEAFHRGFNSLVGNSHPTIWKLINALKKQQNLTEVRIEQIVAGNSNKPKRKKYKDLASRIQRIVESYGQISNLEYLRGIAHNVEYSV